MMAKRGGRRGNFWDRRKNIGKENPMGGKNQRNQCDVRLCRGTLCERGKVKKRKKTGRVE